MIPCRLGGWDCKTCKDYCRSESEIRAASGKAAYTAELFSIDLRKRIEKQFNVPLVVQVGKEYHCVHYADYEVESKTLILRAEEEESAGLQDMLNNMAYNSTLGAKLIVLRFKDGTQAVVGKVSEKEHYRTKFGQTEAVIVEMIEQPTV